MNLVVGVIVQIEGDQITCELVIKIKLRYDLMYHVLLFSITVT